MGWGTADVVEVLWTVAALPGLIVWLVNRAAASRSLEAVRTLGFGNGRMVWAKFGVLLTTAFVAVESTFVLLGVISMLRSRPAQMGGDWTRPALTVGLIGTSLLIAFVGYRWRAVDVYLVSAARDRRVREDNEARELALEQEREQEREQDPL